MKRNACLCLLILAVLLTGCRQTVVEKVCTLPGRETQLAEATESNGDVKDWDVQNISELSLDTNVLGYPFSPAAHFLDHRLIVKQTLDSASGEYVYLIESRDGETMTTIDSFSLPSNSGCFISPDGTKAIYEEKQENGQLLIMLRNLTTHETSMLWDSTYLSLPEDILDILHITGQWSQNGSRFLFVPIFTRSWNDESSSIDAEQKLKEEIDSQSVEDRYAEGIDSASLAELVSLYYYDDTSGGLSTYPLELDPFFPALYYAPLSAPIIVSDETGSQFFIYFSSVNDPIPSIYLNLNTSEAKWLYLNDSIPDFTIVSGSPVFADNLLYIHVESIGIAVLQPETETLLQLYPFSDPIEAFTIFKDTLIVAQPSASTGVDVTAYLLNQDSKKSVLLYHGEANDPFITRMEMNADGTCLLIESIVYTKEGRQKLILLNF